MIKNKCTLILLGMIMSIMMNAAIYCPSDKTIQCYDDIHYLALTGKATVLGFPSYVARYSDENYLNSCHAGYIERRWFEDMNQDGLWQPNENFCIQRINVIYFGIPIQVYFPEDKVYQCKDEIILNKPTWLANPCDVMGYSYKDDVYEIAEDACYKIIRTFTVINWCNPDQQASSSGLPQKWIHRQFIKVIENQAPVITDCEPKIYEAGEDCKAVIILENTAIDEGNCPNQFLSWQAEIDLWSNGIIDYKYGFLERDAFYLQPVQNGSKISITLPEKVAVGKHKIKWSVRDQCGNFRTCHSYFEVKDKKPPTPYMHVIINSAFRGDQMNLTIPAKLFDIASFDNCTPKEKLRFSFSSDVNDTIRIITCNNFGFQFFNIFTTDLEGNSESTEAFMLIFDNGSCSFSHDFQGKVVRSDGINMKNVVLNLTENEKVMMTEISNADGSFVFADLPLMETYVLKPYLDEVQLSKVNIADFLKLKNYLIGLDTLHHFEYVAADVNQDNRISADDLRRMKDMILRPQEYYEMFKGENWRFLSDVNSTILAKDLKNLKSTFSLTDYDGHIDIRAVYSGDITGANALETEERNTTQFLKKLEDKTVWLFPANDIEMMGLQLELKIDFDLLVHASVTSNHLNIADENIVKDYTNGILRILFAENVSLKSNDYIIGIHFNTTQSYHNLTATSHNYIVNNEGRANRIILKDALADDVEVLLFPNPGNGFFNISRPDIEIVSVSDILGKNQAFSVTDNKLQIKNPSGIYLVKTIFNGVHKTHKLIIKD